MSDTYCYRNATEPPSPVCFKCDSQRDTIFYRSPSVNVVRTNPIAVRYFAAPNCLIHNCLHYWDLLREIFKTLILQACQIEATYPSFQGHKLIEQCHAGRHHRLPPTLLRTYLNFTFPLLDRVQCLEPCLDRCTFSKQQCCLTNPNPVPCGPRMPLLSATSLTKPDTKAESCSKNSASKASRTQTYLARTVIHRV